MTADTALSVVVPTTKIPRIIGCSESGSKPATSARGSSLLIALGATIGECRLRERQR